MIDAKTLETLEYFKILDRLEEQATFSLGKEAVRDLRPETDLALVARRLQRTSEARRLLAARPSTHLGGAHDVRSAVRRAEVGAVLNPEELLHTGSTLGAAVRVRASILRGDLELTWLREQAEVMIEGRDFQRSLEATFNDRGEVLDSASPELRRIRSAMHVAQARLMDRLNSIVASPATRPALQEAIVTMRNGRYVVPVRADAKNKVPGVVHDQSSTGQTIFIEPLAVTEMNNRLKELALEEEREIERILQALSQEVAAMGPRLRETVEALGQVDLTFAKARYAESLNAVEPQLNTQGSVRMVDARHPLLGETVVPITVWLGEDFSVLVITGPNTGGKTVALKTVGLITLMAQAGLHVPTAAESEVAVFPNIYADIGDEQSIEQSLSTFSSHMRNIIAMLPQVDQHSLVLLDELGAGTDPAEGAALAQAVLTTLVERGARAVVTTHYSELKTFAHETAGVENASVEFDVETLSPTYRLVIGLPGRSQALAIAKRLGMPQEVLSLARGHISAGAVRVEKLLSQIQAERREISRLYGRAQELHDDAAKIRARLQIELASLERDRDRILAAAREEGAALVRDLRRRLRELESEATVRLPRPAARELRARLEDVVAEVAETLELSGPAAVSQQELPTVRAGATVNVASIGQQGTVLSVHDGEAEVQVGNFKMRLPSADLQVVGGVDKRRAEPAVAFTATRTAPPSEIDVRGWRADDAVRELDQYLHDSYLHGQNTVRIVHGKGTGALRKAIRDQLNEHPLVKGFGSEKPEGGGDGVTVVQLQSS